MFKWPHYRMCMHVLLYLCESNSTLHAGLLKRRLRSSTYTYFQLESTLVLVPTLTTSLFFHTGRNWRRSDHHKRLYEGVIDSTNTYTDESEYGQNDSRCHQHYIAPCTLTTGPCTCGVLLLSISRKYSTCTHGGGHWLQLGLVMLSFSHWREYSLRWW